MEGNAGTANAIFTVSLSEISSKAVTVNFATTNGTAVAGRDYVAATGQLTFDPGQKAMKIMVPVNGDTLRESNEIFRINLSGPTNARIMDAQGVGLIVNDD